MARVVSGIGLVLVWGVVWANLPSKEEWLSADIKPAGVAPVIVPELDLSIPGVPPKRHSSGPPDVGSDSSSSRQRIVRWKDDAEYQAACFEDVSRWCSTVQGGDGRILQCLQQHTADVSDRCYQSLTNGKQSVRR